MSVVPSRLHFAVPRLALFVLTLLLVAVMAINLRAAVLPDPVEVAEINEAMGDTTRAAEAVTRIRKVLATDSLEAAHRDYMRQLLMQALVTNHASTAEIMKEVDGIAPTLGDDIRTNVLFYGQAAQILVQRGEQPKRAIEFAQKAVKATQRDERFAGVGGECRSILGQAQLLHGETDAAIASLTQAMYTAIDTQLVLFHLGQAYEKRGKTDQAINAYVRSLSVFGREDSSAAAPLRALYAKRHGGTKDLDTMLRSARKASSKRVALDARSYEMIAPNWELADFDGKMIQLSDFKGKVLVVDFWGSWCGPCRMELPHIQKIYDQYKDKGVAFIGISWEKESTPEKRLKAAKDFVTQNGYTFPMVVDHDRKAVTAYSVEGFPSVYLIDKTGQIRYKNVGFDPKIADVLSAQIESLME